MSLNTQKRPVLALVGAGPGIGEAVARRFVAEGFYVALLARTEDKLQKMAQGIETDHGKGSAKYYITDLRHESSVLSSFKQIRENLGAISVLVYNAGARRVNGRPFSRLHLRSSRTSQRSTCLARFGRRNVSCPICWQLVRERSSLLAQQALCAETRGYPASHQANSVSARFAKSLHASISQRVSMRHISSSTAPWTGS